MGVVWTSKNKVADLVKDRIIKTKVVLDIGSGIHPQTFFRPFVHICVEPHLPYLNRLQKDVNNDSRYILLNCTWDNAMKNMLPKSVDTVFALDFIEHIQKSEGFKFLQEAERLARRQIVVFTPLGFYPQTYNDSKKLDRWGMDGGSWQTHRSGWLIDDFGDDWNLVCCDAYHFLDEYDQPLEKPIGAIWAFRNFEGRNETLCNSNQYSQMIQRGARKLRHLLKGLVR